MNGGRYGEGRDGGMYGEGRDEGGVVNGGSWKVW